MGILTYIFIGGLLASCFGSVGPSRLMWMGRNSTTEELLASLGNGAKYTEAVLAGNLLQDFPLLLSGLPNLETLDVRENHWKGCESLCGARRLLWVYLDASECILKGKQILSTFCRRNYVKSP